VFQFFNLLPKLSVLQNVELPMMYAGCSGRERRERAMDALRLVEMDNRARHRPMQLSGGQQQRAAIARALVNNPKIVFADEPTGNLDSHTGETILKLFHDLSQKGRTIALVTHDPEIAAVTPRKIEIRDGKIAENVDAKLAGKGEGPKFIVNAESGARNAEQSNAERGTRSAENRTNPEGGTRNEENSNPNT
jgi:putative ABC transport system ATP-binding protein